MFGFSVDELKSLNNLTSNNLSIGQVLNVANSSEDDIEGNDIYIVKSGDSLYKIANDFNTTVDEIKTLNNLSSSLLSIGQKLKIPNKSVSKDVYIVKSGDTLYSIARKFNTTVTEIQSLNNLSSSTLSIGQKLLIP